MVNESEFFAEFARLKQEAGSHSPSIFSLLKKFPEVSIKVDACFLCNPYAFDLFYNRFKKADFEKYIKFYPPQNHEVALNISKFRGIPADRILIGNGAIEIIETLFGNCQNMKILMPIPTFSSYYESSNKDNTIITYQLSEDNDYKINVDEFINYIHESNPDYVLLVNPNNPTGGILTSDEIKKIHQNLKESAFLVVDESFIDFADENHSIEKYATEHSNIIVIRSLSKDFGIAGLRLGYAIMPKKNRDSLLEKSFLWNSNGIAYFFTELLAEDKFQKEYEIAKKEYAEARNDFYKDLVNIGVDVIPSQANFFMIKTPGPAEEYFTKLLYRYGIYTRILKDKWGLSGEWIRIASKDRKENRQMIAAIKKVWNE